MVRPLEEPRKIQFQAIHVTGVNAIQHYRKCSVNPKIRKTALPVGAICVLAWYFWIKVPSPSTNQFASGLVEAFLSRDAKSLASLCSKTELDQYGISQADLEKLLEGEIFPAFDKYYDARYISTSVLRDRIDVYIPPKQGTLLLSGSFFSVTTGAENPVVLSFISNVFRMHSGQYYNPRNSTAFEQWKTMWKQSKHDGPAFKSLGFKGVYSSLTNKIETWSERESMSKLRLDALGYKGE